MAKGHRHTRERRKEDEKNRKKLGEAGVLVLHSWCEYRTCMSGTDLLIGQNEPVN
jgi:hypothetical protein